MGMKRHHEFVTYDKKTLKPKGREGSRLGWFTNEWSRPMLLGCSNMRSRMAGITSIPGGYWRKLRVLSNTLPPPARSEWTTNQGSMTIESSPPPCYFTMHDLDVMIERAKKKYNSPVEEGYSVDYSPFAYQATNISAEETFFERQHD
jgi:hypothetical protein